MPLYRAMLQVLPGQSPQVVSLFHPNIEHRAVNNMVAHNSSKCLTLIFVA